MGSVGPLKRLSPHGITQAVLRSFMAESGLEPHLFGTHFRVTEAIQGKLKFELDIQKQHLNRLHTLHGGTIASLVDLAGSLAVATTGRFTTGVSTDLSTTYLNSSGTAGDLLKGEAICDKIGKSLAYTTVTFYNARGQLSARGSHTKYVRPQPGAPKDYEAPAGWAKDLD